MSAKEIFMPNLKVEFGPPLQSLRCQVDICQNEEQRYQLKNLETLYRPALFQGLSLGMRLGLMSWEVIVQLCFQGLVWGMRLGLMSLIVQLRSQGLVWE